MTVCKSSRVCVRFFSNSVVRMFKARRSTESLLIRLAALLRASCVMFVAVSVRSFRTKASVSASICACCSFCSLMDIFANSMGNHPHAPNIHQREFLGLMNSFKR